MDKRKFLTDEERTQLETTLMNHIEDDTRNATMILTALHTGARAEELLSLKWDEIYLKTGEIYLATLKGGKPRQVVVPKHVRAALARLKTLSPERPFGISYQRLVEIWNLYRPVNKPLRSMRHAFAIHAYDKTKDIRFVQYALGHRSITNTMVYAEYHYTTQEFKKMMRVR